MFIDIVTKTCTCNILKDIFSAVKIENFIGKKKKIYFTFLLKTSIVDTR